VTAGTGVTLDLPTTRRFRGRPGTQIDRYVLQQLGVALTATTCGLAALTWLTQSLRFVELVVNRGLSLSVFLGLSGLQIPYFISVILPITTFVSVQMVYQRLSGDRELTVMRAAGLSSWSLARPALALAVLSVALGYLLNLVAVPAAVTTFRDYQFEIRNRIAAFLLQEGVFTAVSDDLTIYVRARDPNGMLRGILIEDSRQKDNPATILAERGELVADTGVPRVVLINGGRQEIDRQTGRLNVLSFATNTVELAPSARGNEQRVRDFTEMSVSELLHPAAGRFSPADHKRAIAEAHRRLASPLTALSFTLVALVASLTGPFRRHGGVLRLAAAVLVIVALLALGLVIGTLAAKHTALVALIWVQAVLPGILCGWLLFGPPLRLLPETAQARTGAV